MDDAPDRSEHDDREFEFCPWLFAKGADDRQRAEQRERQRRLAARGAVRLGEDCFVAASAAVFPETLHLGDRSYIAAQAYVTDDVRIGADCTLNPFTTVRGTVRLGDGVRIGAHSSLLGFNHSSAIDRPIYRQPVTSRGISVGDDVWIGSHVVVVDGVRIGDHCIIGAGAVVTKDIPDWSVAAGNPARVLRDRRAPRIAPPAGAGAPASGSALADARTVTGGVTRGVTVAVTGGVDALQGNLEEDLDRFAAAARAQAAELIARCWDAGAPGGGQYSDRPGAAPTVRAHCDAVELAELLLGTAPGQLSREEHIDRLRRAQDPETGLIPQLDPATGLPGALPPPDRDGFVEDGAVHYHVLSAGYALDLLGSALPYPIRPVRQMAAGELISRLESLPWRLRAWSAGSWIDSWATAAHWSLGHGAPPETGALEALFGWLTTRADARTGLWGHPAPDGDLLQPVNGFFRLTRGSFAQFGVQLPRPERVIDAVLDHAGNPRYFGADRENACNILDVAHPLWLCGRQSDHRVSEVRAWARVQLSAALPRWRDGRGFAFGPAPEGTGPGREPGLQGTEMWLAVIWYLADLTGCSDLLGYRPRGVHRPEPARALTGLG